MTDVKASGRRFMHGLLLGTTALALIGSGAANARVGVTSAAEGDPLGKPPAEVERVLRIGVDVQANEVITTNANDRAHLVFLDGTSLTVGPGARLTIDKFVYDPATKTGELAINATKGVFRLVGGKISKTTPIVITTPSAYVGVRGGITVVDVQATETAAVFMFGKDMTVTGNGQTQVVTRPGTQVVTNIGMPPGQPALVPQGVLAAQMKLLEGRSSAGAGGGGQGSTAASVKIVAGTQVLAQQAPAGTFTNAAFASGSGTSTQTAGWQQFGAGVAYANPSNLNPAAQLPLTGSATYNGSFSANSSNSGSFGGTFNMGWNFGSQTGNFTLVSNGQNGNTGSASGNLAATSSGFGGPLTVTTGEKGSLTGNFVPTSSSPVGGVQGSFKGGTSGSEFTGNFSGRK